jgi:hypothetical protein
VLILVGFLRRSTNELLISDTTGCACQVAA